MPEQKSGEALMSLDDFNRLVEPMFYEARMEAIIESGGYHLTVRNGGFRGGTYSKFIKINLEELERNPNRFYPQLSVALSDLVERLRKKAT